MINALYYLLFAFVITYGLYVFYCAVMSIKRVRDMGKLTKLGMAFGYPTLVIGLLLDFLCNVFVMSPLFLELPRELTVTSRLKRHNRSDSGWRTALARWFEPVLDPIDPSGDHI